MSTYSPNYRKLTKDEILDISAQLQFEDRIDLNEVREGVTRLFGPTAHKAVLGFENEYNDETQDLRPTDIKVWDANGKRIKRPKAEDDWDEELYDFYREIQISDCGQNDELPDLTIFMDDTNKRLKLTDLYVQEAPVLPSDPI